MPVMEKPLQTGIPCVVFRRELEVACPELPEFLSQAGNQSHDVHAKETKVQIILSLARFFNQQEKSNRSGTPGAPGTMLPWDIVKRKMKAMKPHIKPEDIDEAVAFVASWGGNDGLVEVEAYAKQLPKRREPELGQLQLLACAKVSQFPMWPLACLKACLQAPDDWLSKTGQAKLFCSADIKAMESKNVVPKIRKAVDMMQKARAWLGRT